MGLAPFDPPLPPDMTVLEYVTWSARLAGKHARDAARLAKEACERASLTDMAMRRLGELGLVPRRLAVLAQAAVVPSSLVVADHPLRGLDAASAGFVLARLAKLVGEANVVVSTARFEAESPAESLARGASTVVVLAGGRALEVAPPSGIRTLWRVNEAETSPHAAEDAASSPTEAP
jgi:ABC-2 type transport system ATP-binding protein